MIIACPNCTKPYQLPDEQVAPLVQVQCAHCDYRVIYDFEAANDPSLREPDMLLADGFRSEADYDQALADGHSVTKHDLPAPTRVPTTPPAAAAKTTQSAESPTPVSRPKSGGLVSGLGLSDTPGSLAAAVTEHDKTEQTAAPEADKPVEAKPPETTVTPEPETAKPEPETTAKPEPETAKPEPETAKPVETKPVEAKPVETKPVETKVKDPEPVETKPVETKVKDPEPEKVATPPAEDEGKGSGPFWIILVILVILIFVVTYVKTGQLNPALLLQPGK